MEVDTVFQTLFLSLLAFMGFAPTTPAPPHPGRVGPGPTGRRHAILPTPATISAPSTGPGPGGRRHAIHRTPTRSVAQAVAHPVVQPEPAVTVRNKPSMREMQEAAYALGLRTTETVRAIPAGLAVRYFQAQAGCAPSQDGLGRVTRREAEMSLGRDLASYVELCLSSGTKLLGISPDTETEGDALYRVRLRKSMEGDVELWEAAARARDRQRAEALAAGIPQPEAFRIPHEIEMIIAQRAAAQLAMLKRRKETQQGGTATGKSGGNVVQFPAGDQPPEPAGPPPEAHDADVQTVPAGPK